MRRQGHVPPAVGAGRAAKVSVGGVGGPVTTRAAKSSKKKDYEK